MLLRGEDLEGTSCARASLGDSVTSTPLIAKTSPLRAAPFTTTRRLASMLNLVQYHMIFHSEGAQNKRAFSERGRTNRRLQLPGIQAKIGITARVACCSTEDSPCDNHRLRISRGAVPGVPQNMTAT